MGRLDKRIQAREDAYYIDRMGYRRAKRKIKDEDRFWILNGTAFFLGFILAYLFKNLWFLLISLISGIGIYRVYKKGYE